MTISVQPGQSLPDICIQYLGRASRVSEVAILNNLEDSSIALPSGTVLELPLIHQKDQPLVDFFLQQNITVATL